MMGSAKYWCGPRRWFRENRPKSGMFTAMLENSPIITLSPVSAEYAGPIGVVRAILPVTSSPPPLVTLGRCQMNPVDGEGGIRLT